MKYPAWAAAAAILLACATPAAAQGMRAICNNNPHPPCVFDGNGKIVGVVAGFGAVLRRINDNWYLLSDIKRGSLHPAVPVITPQGTYYYAGPNCTGQKYFITYGDIPEIAEYDGQNFWSVDLNVPLTLGFDWAVNRSPRQPKPAASAQSVLIRDNHAMPIAVLRPL